MLSDRNTPDSFDSFCNSCLQPVKISRYVTDCGDKLSSIDLAVQDIAIGAGGHNFDSRAGQIGSSVANGLPPLRCFFGPILPRR